MRAWVLVICLLVGCQERGAEECHERICSILKVMGDRLAQVESSADFEKQTAALEADHVQLVSILGRLRKMGALLPSEEPLEMVHIKERLEEQLERVLQMEGGPDWIEALQKAALDELDRIDPGTV